MNKSLKAIICLGLFCMTAVGPAQAKKHRVQQKPVYMVGVCMSLTDSAIFITDMHCVDSVTIENKTHFLMDRQLYSLQLKRYMESHFKGGPYIPAVYSSPKRKKMERRYLSLHKRYVQSKAMHMFLIDQSQFRFKGEKYIGQDEEKESKKKKTKPKFHIETPNIVDVVTDVVGGAIEEHERKRATKR